MQDLQHHAARMEQAYAAHRRIYTMQNPPPKPAKDSGRNWLLIVALAVSLVGASYTSGTRTVPEFGGGLNGFAAFLFLDFFVVLAAFYLVYYGQGDNHNGQHRPKWRTVAVMVFAGLILIMANVHHVLLTAGIVLDATINTIINVCVGISAPVLSWNIGEIVAIELFANRRDREAAARAYAAALQQWTDGLNQAFEVQRTKWRVNYKPAADDQITITRPPLSVAPRPLLPTDTPTDADNGGTTDASADNSGATDERADAAYASRNMDARAEVFAFFDANPEAVALGVRALEGKVKAKRSSISKFRAEWITAQQVKNNENPTA